MNNMIVLYDYREFEYKINTCLYGEITWIENMLREKFRIEKNKKRKCCLEIIKEKNMARLWVDDIGIKDCKNIRR